MRFNGTKYSTRGVIPLDSTNFEFEQSTEFKLNFYGRVFLQNLGIHVNKIAASQLSIVCNTQQPYS